MWKILPLIEKMDAQSVVCFGCIIINIWISCIWKYRRLNLGWVKDVAIMQLNVDICLKVSTVQKIPGYVMFPVLIQEKKMFMFIIWKWNKILHAVIHVGTVQCGLWTTCWRLSVLCNVEIDSVYHIIREIGLSSQNECDSVAIGCSS